MKFLKELFYNLKLKNLKKSLLVKNISYLAIGKGLSQVVSLIGAFYIPRLLGPEDYGIYQTVLSYVNLFIFFTLVGFDKTAIRESSKNIQQAKNIIESILGIKYLTAIVGIIISILVLIFIDYDYTTKIYIVIFSVSLIFKSVHNALYVIYKAHERLKIVAIFDILRTVLIVSVAIILVKLGYGVFELIVSNLIIVAIFTLSNFLYSKKYFSIQLFPKVVFIKKYIRPGINFSIINLLNTLSSRVDIFMLTLLTSPTNVGIYALAYRMFEKIISLKGAISQSILPNYSKRLKNNKLKIGDLYKHSSYMFILSGLVVLVVNLFSKPFVLNIIGEEYIKSAHIINILVVNFAIGFLSIPWSMLLQVSNNEKKLIYLGTIRAILNIFLNLVFFKLFGLFGIVYSTLVSHLIYLLFLLFVIHKKIKYKKV
ncbi:MAG: flippase [archaeon]